MAITVDKIRKVAMTPEADPTSMVVEVWYYKSSAPEEQYITYTQHPSESVVAKFNEHTAILAEPLDPVDEL